MVKKAFLDAFSTKEDLEALFQENLPGRSLDANAMGPNLEIIILNLIGKATEEGWLMRLLDAAIARTDNPNVKQAAAELKPLRRSEEEDPHHVCFLSSNKVMVNRIDLRKALKQLGTNEGLGYRLLKIYGTPVSGKSYSKELIKYLKSRRDGFEPVFIEADDYPEGITASDLADAIVTKMGFKSTELMPPPDQEQDSRWVRNFSNRLIGVLRNNPTYWWIVIDGFDELVLPPAVTDLIIRLARASMADLPRLRLITLGYRYELPDARDYTIEETLKPLNWNDLSNFFIRLYEQHGQDFDVEKIADHVAEVLREVKQNDPRRIEKLGLEAARVAKSVITIE